MIRKIEVVKNGNQFQVMAWFRAPMEDMFETIFHPALFRSEDRATAFMKKIKKGNPNLSNWILPTDITSHIQSKVNPGIYSVI